MKEISHEVEDEIEDGEGADVTVQFCPESEDINRFLNFRKHLKKNKSLWLVQDPEKLLLPAIIKHDFEPQPEDIESIVESMPVSEWIFRQALSRVGIDLVDHFNMLQEDPSKVPGAFQFESSARTGAHHFPSTVKRSSVLQGSEDQDCERQVHLNKDNCAKAKKDWDDLCSSAGMVTTSPRSECMETSECDNVQRRQQDIPFLQATESIIMLEENSSSMMYECESLNMKDNGFDDFSWATANISGIECIESEKVTDNDADHLMHSSNMGFYQVPAAMEIKENVGIQTDEMVKRYCSSSSNRHYSFPENKDNLQMEKGIQSDAGHESEDQAAVALENSNCSCMSSEMVSFQNNLPCEENGSTKEEKESLHEGKTKVLLDELITGAVIAECQLHQNVLARFDLEPLSRLLSMHMASIFERQNRTSIVLKDLVAACGCAEDITLQRYIVALLSAAHQKNIGSWKDSRMEGHQILLQEGVSGKLCDVEIKVFENSKFDC